MYDRITWHENNKSYLLSVIYYLLSILHADVAELADALDSGSSESNFIWVQVPSSAPKIKKEGLSLFFDFSLQEIILVFKLLDKNNKKWGTLMPPDLFTN